MNRENGSQNWTLRPINCVMVPVLLRGECGGGRKPEEGNGGTIQSQEIKYTSVCTKKKHVIRKDSLRRVNGFPFPALLSALFCPL